jgi:hypothetical protein
MAHIKKNELGITTPPTPPPYEGGGKGVVVEVISCTFLSINDVHSLSKKTRTLSINPFLYTILVATDVY